MENKKETLEKVAKECLKENNLSTEGDFAEGYILGGIFGAKWQAERMYSEEDMREAYNQGKNSINPYYGRTFENFLDTLKLKK